MRKHAVTLEDLSAAADQLSCKETTVAGELEWVMSKETNDAKNLAVAALPALLAAVEMLQQVRRAGPISLTLNAEAWHAAMDEALSPFQPESVDA